MMDLDVSGGQRCLCAGLRGHMGANMEDSQTHKSFVTCHDECGSIRGFVSYLCLGLSEPTEHLCPTLVKPKPLIVEKVPPIYSYFVLFIYRPKESFPQCTGNSLYFAHFLSAHLGLAARQMESR